MTQLIIGHFDALPAELPTNLELFVSHLDIFFFLLHCTRVLELRHVAWFGQSRRIAFDL